MSTAKKKPRKGVSSAPSRHPGGPLRALRAGRGLTLDQLSRMAGVSKAMLSQIEQQKVNPTVAVVLKIADAFRVGVGELIAAPAGRNISRVISAGDRHYVFRADASCTIRTLSPLSLEKAIEFYRITLERGGALHSEPHFPGTEEFLHLAKGRLAVTSGQETARIAKSDSIHYRADVPHVLRNVGSGQAVAYLIVRYRSD